MNDNPANLTCVIELKCDEKLSLPQPLVDSVGPGRWLITVQALADKELLDGFSPQSLRFSQ
jgi:hypothetical protein